MTRWMDSAQAHYKSQEYDRQHPQTPTEPTTEAEALRTYRVSLSMKWPWENSNAKIQRLEALARENGWTALEDYRADFNNRLKIHQQREREETHANNQKEAAMPRKLTDYTADLHNQFADIISGHDALSREWRDALSSKNVSREYVKEQTSIQTQARKVQLDAILNEANTFVADAQADYDRAYTALTATSGDTNEQLLAEMRATKAWDRMQRELTNVDPMRLTDELTRRVATADPDTLRTLIDEMPSFLAGRGIPDADAVVKAAVSARPELADAKARINDAAKVQAVVMHDTQHISDRLNDITDKDVTPDTWVAYVNPDTAIGGTNHA